MTRYRRRIALTAVLVAVFLVVGLAPFLRARTHAPSRADAVVVLSGDHGERQPVALRLLNDGVAHTLVLVGTTDGTVEGDLCSARRAFEVVCLRLNPDSTRDEARATADLARRRGWTHIVVVTSTYHAARAQMLFRRCVNGTTDTMSAWPPLGRGEAIRQLVHEWLGSVAALASAFRC